MPKEIDSGLTGIGLFEGRRHGFAAAGAEFVGFGRARARFGFDLDLHFEEFVGVQGGEFFGEFEFAEFEDPQGRAADVLAGDFAVVEEGGAGGAEVRLPPAFE